VFHIGVDALGVNGPLILFLSALLNVVSVANYMQSRQLQMMPTSTYFVKWLIPVIVFTLSFLLLKLVTITSDPKDMHCPDVTLRSIRSHLSHVAFLNTYNVFIHFYVRFYHCMCIHFSVSTVTCTCVTCYIKYQSYKIKTQTT